MFTSAFTKKIRARLSDSWYLILLSLIIIILRVPSLIEPNWYLDEMMYLTIGQAINRGLTLYVDIFDHKPPLIYFLAALAKTQFILRIILIFLNIISLWAMSRILNMVENLVVKRIALLGFVIATASPLLEANIFNGEIVMLPFILVAFALLMPVFEGNKLYLPKAFLAGILFGLATLTKMTAVMDVMAVLVTLIIAFSFGDKLQKVGHILLLMAIGFITIWAIPVTYYLLQQQFISFIWAAFAYNTSYIKAFDSFVVFGHEITTKVKLLFLGLTVCLALSQSKIDSSKLARLGIIWLGFALFSVIWPNRNYSHYLIQIVPPLIILLAVLIDNSKVSVRSTVVLAIIVALAVLRLFSFGLIKIHPYYETYYAYKHQNKISQFDYERSFESRTDKFNMVANYIENVSTPSDNIWVIGEYPQIYYVSNRMPPTKYLTIFQLEENFSPNDLTEILDQNKPKFVVEIEKSAIHDPEILKVYEDFVLENYQLDSNLDGIIIYRVKNPKI